MKNKALEPSEQPPKRKKKKSDAFLNTLVVILFLIGFGILLYPTTSNLWNEWRNSRLIDHYQSTVNDISADQRKEILEEAEAYNAQHTVNTSVDAFDGEDYVLTHPYDTLLNFSDNGVMGYLDIPKISLHLAIYHGVGTTALENGIGHMEGTSLPVGGESSHAVLAGHRGLPSAKLFTDLDQLEIGDQFYLNILDETLAYEVDQIRVVDPDDASLLQIEKGEDLVTLLTCTPYGVNTQRLLVRGHRVAYSEEKAEEQTSERIVSDRDMAVYVLALALLLMVLLFVLYLLLRDHKKRKNRRRQTDGRVKRGEA